MSLFSDLPHNQELKGVAKAVMRLQETLAQLPGAGPHSLCELCPDEADYQWLCHWAAHLSCGAVSLTRWLSGALALFLAAEAARREAQEGHVWPIMQGLFEEETHRKFFTANGQPTLEFKKLLKEAAVQLNLRHVFGREGTHEWYVSIYLQFGFTRKGMETNLPDWLAGLHLTGAIIHLRDLEKGSNSFQQLWNALRNYRRDFLTKEQVRHVIRTSPWVLRSWEEDLLRLARESLSLGTESDLPVETPEVETRPFLLPPRLEWEPPEEPRFACGVTNLDGLGLSADHYHLQMGAATLATVFRQPDETYLPDRSEVSLPSTLAQAIVSIVDSLGRVYASQALDLWEAQEDVNVFDGETGRRISEREQVRLHTPHSYVLHTAADLVICPPQAVWRRLGGPMGRLLTLLPPGWPEELQVLTPSGSPLWNPQLVQGAAPKQVPSWAEKVRVRWLSADAPVNLGQTLRPDVQGLAPGVSLTYVRLGGRALNFDPLQGVLGEVTVTPELALAGLHFLIGLACDNEHVQIRSTLKVTILGAAQCTEQGWEPLRPTGTLTVREARDNVYRLFLPADLGDQKVALMEGSLHLNSLGRRPRPLGRLSGIGAPLVVRRAPYNCPDDLCQLADAVVDHGIVRYLEFTGKEAAYHLRLTRPIQPGPGHQVVCWFVSQGLELVEHEQIGAPEEGRVWRVACTRQENADRAVIAIAYQGCWRGSGWLCGLKKLLSAVEQNSTSPRQTAAMIRWCHLPVLQTPDGGQRPVLEAFAQTYAADVLAAWLFDNGLDGSGLLFDKSAESDRAAQAALRTLFDGWQPPPDQLQAIVGLFGQDNPVQPLGLLSHYLLPVDPLLTGRVVLAWLKAHGPPQTSRATAAQYVRLLLRDAADLPSGASDYQVRQRQTDALEQAAQTMRADSISAVDPNFVKEGIADPAVNALQNGGLNRVKAVNLAVALQVGSFRHYLGLRVLDKVAGLL